jgi:hypothetical protein
MEHKGYGEAVPCAETIRVKLNMLGYHPARVAKTKPKKGSSSLRVHHDEKPLEVG